MVERDSYDLQFWDSEQYQRGIPLLGDGSCRCGNGAALFSAEEIERWKQEAERLNKAGAGDQAVFYLKLAPNR